MSERFGSFNPRVNVVETEREIRVTAELPGMTEKEVELTLAGDALVIRGEKRAEHEEKDEGGRRLYTERSYGSFQRSIPLSCEIEEDKVDASYRNGVLTIVLPKSKAGQSASKKISIRGS
ncbi:MAG: Hsp20/alpha crystallin family protein [Bdellovibrionota bacterium]|nr:MAG: Hsp20/alpha crystallin family protein [Bdellovibrionota bacterium]